jgi:hypothetical protein
MGAADESSLAESVDVIGPHPCLGVTPQSAAQHKQSRAFVHKLLMDYHPRAKSAELAKLIADQARDVSLEDENAHDVEAPAESTWPQEEMKQKERDAVLKAQMNLARAEAMLAKHSELPSDSMDLKLKSRKSASEKRKREADEAMTKALEALLDRRQLGDLGLTPEEEMDFTKSMDTETLLEAMTESLKTQRDVESTYYLSGYQQKLEEEAKAAEEAAEEKRKAREAAREATKEAKKEAREAAMEAAEEKRKARDYRAKKEAAKEAERVSCEYECCGCGELLKRSAGHSAHSNKCNSIDPNTRYCIFDASGSAAEHAQLKRMLKSIGSSSHGRAKCVLPDHVEAVAASVGGVSADELTAYCRGNSSAELSSSMGLRLRKWLLMTPLLYQVGGGFVLGEEQEREANGPRGKKRRLSEQQAFQQPLHLQHQPVHLHPLPQQVQLLVSQLVFPDHHQLQQQLQQHQSFQIPQQQHLSGFKSTP